MQIHQQSPLDAPHTPTGTHTLSQRSRVHTAHRTRTRTTLSGRFNTPSLPNPCSPPLLTLAYPPTLFPPLLSLAYSPFPPPLPCSLSPRQVHAASCAAILAESVMCQTALTAAGAEEPLVQVSAQEAARTHTPAAEAPPPPPPCVYCAPLWQ
eukprot:scaffold11233_cov72-Isochrysis_galbana.AAC.2